MPYPITLKQPAERVTDENAPVTFTDPQSPLLNAPNKITQADFNGWVQERASYMPSTFDSHYRTMLAMSDPGEQPNRAAILAAPYGVGPTSMCRSRSFASFCRRTRWRAHLRQPARRQYH